MSNFKKINKAKEMLKLSACMIVKNEESVIERCINSYKAIVDEIIVVDTGSSDETKKIALELGADVYDFNWEGDFSAAKNFALGKATGNWVIFLDADEYFPNDMAKKIPDLVKKYGQGQRKIILTKMINIDEDDGEILCDFSQARIFKNESTLRYSGKIHESLKSSGPKIEAVLVDEKELKIMHTGYSKRLAEEKARRNLDMLLQEIENGNNDPRLYSYIATSYSTLKQPEEAIKYSKKYLKSGAKMEGIDSKLYYLLIADMMAINSDFEEVYEIIQEAIKKFNDNPMPYAYLGQWYYAKKEYQKAIESFEKTINLQKKYCGIEMNFILGKEAHIYHILGSLYELKGDFQKSSEMYLESLENNSNIEEVLLSFFRINREIELNKLEKTLFALYDLERKDSVLLLNDAALKIKHKLGLKYCVEVLKKKFMHEDYSSVFVNVMDGDYLIAFKHFLEAYQLTTDEYYLYYATIISQLSKMPAMLELIYEQTSGFLRKYVDYLTKRKKTIFFDKNDIVGYQLYLNELILITEDKELLESALNLSKFFEENNDEIKNWVISLLFQEKKHSILVAFLENVDKNKNDYVALGRAHWYLKEYELSVVNLGIALELGYCENDLTEYLKWISECELNQSTINELEKIKKRNADSNDLQEKQLRFMNNDDKVGINQAIELYNAGEWQKALDVLKKELESGTENYNLLYNLGLLYEKLDNKTEAINYYRQARNLLNIDQEYDRYVEIVKRIKKVFDADRLDKSQLYKIESAHIKQPEVSDSLNVNRVNFYNSLNTRTVFTATIVVWAYNRIEKTKNCVESILKWTTDIDYELILIDHGSTDGTLEYFYDVKHDNKVVINIEKNVHGFGGRLIDSIIENRKSRYLVIVPNDVYVTPNWLINLLRCMESDHRIGWVMPVSTNVSNFQEIKKEIRSLNDLYEFAKSYNQYNPLKWEERMRLVNVLTIYKREILDMVGHVDAGFFHDFGEDDYSMRLRRNGYRLVLCGDTMVHHDHDFREMEDKDKTNYKTSLEMGRLNFKEKYKGIDAWNDILNFEFEMVELITQDINRHGVKILGIDVRCGTPLLTVQNELRKLGINDVSKYAYTTEAKYFYDLQTICDNQKVVCDRIEYIKQHFREKYDLILLGEPINQYDNSVTLIKEVLAKLSDNGKFAFKILKGEMSGVEFSKVVKNLVEELKKQNCKKLRQKRLIFSVSSEEELEIRQMLSEIRLTSEEDYLDAMTREYIICIER